MFPFLQAEGLRDTLPPSDKSLGKLLSEAPDFPLAALDLLQALCNPDPETKDGLESPVTERITQGLSAVWSLILLRPPIRSECLNIALQVIVYGLFRNIDYFCIGRTYSQFLCS